MSFITGIGGVILFSSNPKKLSEWYRDILGIEGFASPDGSAYYKTYEQRDLENSNIKRTTAWAILKAESDISATPRTSKINYRVRNTRAVHEHLKAKGITIVKTEEHAYGKFTTITDPENNTVELWEETPESVS